MLTKSGTNVVSAAPGSVGERILDELAEPSQEPRNHKRFLDISYGDRRTRECSVLTKEGERLRITLKIGVQEGIFIKEVEGSKLSIRIRGHIIEVGGHPSEKIKNIANQIVGELLARARRLSAKEGNENRESDSENGKKKSRNRIGAWKRRSDLREKTEGYFTSL